MDFRIVIDSREQEPYTFACEVVKAKLDAGDYSVVGFEQRVAVERKHPIEPLDQGLGSITGFVGFSGSDSVSSCEVVNRLLVAARRDSCFPQVTLDWQSESTLNRGYTLSPTWRFSEVRN